ncbi:MAG: DEAD/DEAH box helicase [Sedimentisphaerales bacterium]
MPVFSRCKEISHYIDSNQEDFARNELIKLLDYLETHKIEYTPIVNHLIRQVGLFPYLKVDHAIWQDRLIYELFKVDIGTDKPVTLHRDQSILLKKLLNGENIAVSAPTSFGKSFVIDAFISIKKPKNVVLIVPTIALTDETRRRLYTKFADTYKIITTTEVKLDDKNILIFPQERAINYVNQIDKIDILIIDEFYKASSDFDKERSPALIRAILQLEKKASQRYFLAPNISNLPDNPFTQGMEFVPLDCNTVFLEKYDWFKEIKKNEELKARKLLEVLNQKKAKTLIYAGTYSEIDKVSKFLIFSLPNSEKKLLNNFANWLYVNYGKDYELIKLVQRGTGIHNGSLHRSLSQIQIKLFEESDGLDNIISTSSIIEGVNTSAENVVIWRNKNGRSPLNDFTYKNVIGRSGRMFKHFVGKAYILEKPPQNEYTQLNIEFPDGLLADVDEELLKKELTQEQVAKIVLDKKEMCDLLGEGIFDKLIKENAFQSSTFDLIKKIAIDMRNNSQGWNGLSYLNSDDVNSWDRFLYKIINLQPESWGIGFGKYVNFIKILSQNWNKSIPELLQEINDTEITVDKFFKLERNTTFKFAAIANDVNILQKTILKSKGMDISPFISKLTHAFLPSMVYQLEEYGLPRMISKKIHKTGLFNFENSELTIHDIIDTFNKIGKTNLFKNVPSLDEFDKYIIAYFYEGITLITKPSTLQ